MNQNRVDIVFSLPPDHRSPRFIEVEDVQGRSVRLGNWVNRGDGTWALRITEADFVAAEQLMADGEATLAVAECDR